MSMRRIAQAKLRRTIHIVGRLLKSPNLRRQTWLEVMARDEDVHARRPASIDARDASHHYATVMNYAHVMKKRCFA